VEYIEEVFTPLVEKCKSLGRAMRIGTNHGSLSARILSFYGDTPKGMVEVRKGEREGGREGWFEKFKSLGRAMRIGTNHGPSLPVPFPSTATRLRGWWR